MRGVTVNNIEGSVRLFIAEEQQLLRDAYQSVLKNTDGVEVVGSTSYVDQDALMAAAAATKPDVMIVGAASLTAELVEGLKDVRREAPGMGFVLLSFAYDSKSIMALREFSKRAGAGCAYLLKHTVNTVEQLMQAVSAVDQGRIIFDPTVLEEMVTASEPRVGMLKNLSPREIEVLGWMARGYRNNAIAKILHLEPKTVERHINNIYAKLGDVPNSKHPRIQAIAMYLTAAGVKSVDWLEEEDPLDDYGPKASSAKFQPTTPNSRAMEGNRSFPGTSHAMTSGPATFNRNNPFGLS